MLGLHTAITTTFAVHHQLLPDDRLPTQKEQEQTRKKGLKSCLLMESCSKAQSISMCTQQMTHSPAKPRELTHVVGTNL
jgi:hypothetical protein